MDYEKVMSNLKEVRKSLNEIFRKETGDPAEE